MSEPKPLATQLTDELEGLVTLLEMVADDLERLGRTNSAGGLRRRAALAAELVAKARAAQ